MLQSFGYMFDVPAALLGQTALAWGNSVGDAFANAALARQGQTKMAITGCFAAPLFNVLCGFGAALLVECIKGICNRRYAFILCHGFEYCTMLMIVFVCSIPRAVHRGCSNRPFAWKCTCIPIRRTGHSAGRGCVQCQYITRQLLCLII